MALTVTYTNTPIVNPNQTIEEFLAAFDNAKLNSLFPETAGKTALEVWEAVTTDLNNIRANHGMVETTSSDTTVVQTYPSQEDKDAADAAVESYLAALPNSPTEPALTKDSLAVADYISRLPTPPSAEEAAAIAAKGVPALDNKTDRNPIMDSKSAFMYITSKYFKEVKNSTETVS